MITYLAVCVWLHTGSQPSISASTHKRNHPAAEDTPRVEEPQVELSMYSKTTLGTVHDHFLHLSLIHAAIGDLLEVTNYLLDFGKTDIHNLGLTLGLHYPHFTKMGGSETFIDDVIAAWLRKEDQVLKQGVPSWETLVKALRNRRVNQTGVAEKIATDKSIVV